ncbi:MAG: pyridoxamine 5'-phosphate oxidase family protein [Bacteroidota bacterium]
MGKVFEKIEPRIKTFIEQQKLFFVSTAPLSAEGLVNVSPKGLDSLRILDDLTVAYIDLTGSGAETIAHLKENQRITFLFCAFDGPPKLVRLYGKGEVFERGTPEFDRLKNHFPEYASARSIIKVSLTRVSDSCGYTVPLYEFKEDRDTMKKWVAKKDEDSLKAYRALKNRKSLDGLTAFEGKGELEL